MRYEVVRRQIRVVIREGLGCSVAGLGPYMQGFSRYRVGSRW